MITHKIISSERIVIVAPSDPLTANDFKELTASVDAFLKVHDSLRGLMIHTREFPGWESFAGFIQHMKFVKDHHRKIQRVALVSDSKVASIAPHFAEHFVSAKVRSFPYDSHDEALAWLNGDAGE